MTTRQDGASGLNMGGVADVGADADADEQWVIDLDDLEGPQVTFHVSGGPKLSAALKAHLTHAEAEIVDATEEHQANVAAAHALVTIRRRTGRPIPAHIQALADEAPARPVTRRRRWWQR